MAEIGSAFLSIMASARDVPGQIDKQVTPGLTKVGKKSGISFGKAFGAVAALGIGAKVAGFLGDSLGEAREAQKVSAQTTNVLKTMGLQSKVTADQIGAYATKLSNATGIDDELIQTSQNTLLTFGNLAKSAGVTGGAFQRASGLALDMSVALGTDLKGATVQIGKALNDPIKGITALSRSGVSFTEQQKKTIKSLVEGGKVGKAQGLILRELGKEFKGSAAAQATAGDKAAVSFGNLKEQIGTALLPVVDKLATVASTKVIPAISGFVTGIQTGAGAGGKFASVVKTIGANFGTIAPILGTVVAGLAAYKVASAAAAAISVIQAAGTTAATGATFSLNAALRANPIGLVVTALTLLVGGFILAYKKSDTFRALVTGALNVVKSVASSVANFFTNKVPAAFNKVVGAAKSVLGFVKGNWPKILAVLTGPIGIAVLLIVKNWDRIKEGFSLMVNGVKKIAGNLVSFVKGIPGKITGALGDLGSLLKNAGEQVINGLIKGIEAKLSALKSKLSSVTNFIKDHKGPESVDKVLLVPAGQNIMDGLINGITSREKALGKKLGKVTKDIRDKVSEAVGSLKSDFASLSDSVAGNLTGSLFSGFDTAGSFLANLGTVKGNLGSALADFKTLKGFGLPASFLAKLFADGGFPLIHELAANQGQAAAAASLFGDVQAISGQLGNSVAQADIGPKLDQQVALLKAIDKKLGNAPAATGAAVGHQVNGAAAKGARSGKKGPSRRGR